MRISEVQHIKNKLGTIWIAGLTIDITVLDIREAYGNLQYLITPTSGSGVVWVIADRVTIVEGVKK